MVFGMSLLDGSKSRAAKYSSKYSSLNIATLVLRRIKHDVTHILLTNTVKTSKSDGTPSGLILKILQISACGAYALEVDQHYMKVKKSDSHECADIKGKFQAGFMRCTSRNVHYLI